MVDLVEYFLLARTKNGDAVGWMQLLVFVIIAVLYVLSAVVKARSNRESSESESAEAQQGGSRAGATKRNSVLKQFLKEVTDEKSWTANPAEKEAWQNQARGSASPLVAKPEKATQQKKVSAAKAGTIRKKTVEAQIETEEVGLREQLRLADQDDLQTAILHGEILGKCIALREPGD